jgi:hypothetical protein
LRRQEALFSIEQILQLSMGKESYQWMCTTFVGCIVGSKTWNKRRSKERVSDIATCSDEAFLLLTVENNYSRWLAEAAWTARNKDKAPHDREVKDYPSAKYTNSGQSKRDGRSKRLQGWAREGYLRFNKLYQLVARDRNRRAKFEEHLLETLRDAMRPDQALHCPSDDDEDAIFPANDLIGVASGECDDDQSSESGGSSDGDN